MEKATSLVAWLAVTNLILMVSSITIGSHKGSHFKRRYVFVISNILAFSSFLSTLNRYKTLTQISLQCCTTPQYSSLNPFEYQTMDKNNGSNSSVCNKIRQALASNPAVRAVQRITSFNQEPKPVTTKHPKTPSSITNIPIQNKPHPYHKAHKEESGSGAIPIKFDHSTPKLSNGNSAVSSGAKDAERSNKVAAKGEPHPQHVPMQGYKQHGHGVHTESPHGKKPIDINDHFKDFIQQTREKMMRSMTNIGWGQSNHAAAPDHDPQHGSNKNESHFSDFIQRARKKLRTTTTGRKNNSANKQ